MLSHRIGPFQTLNAPGHMAMININSGSKSRDFFKREIIEDLQILLIDKT